MKRTHLASVSIIALVLMSVVGCGKPLEEKLIGKWEVDKDKLIHDMKSAGADAKEIEVAREVDSTLIIEFKEGGEFSLSEGGQGVGNGTWKVLSSRSDELVCEMTIAEAATKVTTKLTLKFVDNDAFEMRTDDPNPRTWQIASYNRID